MKKSCDFMFIMFYVYFTIPILALLWTYPDYTCLSDDLVISPWKAFFLQILLRIHSFFHSLPMLHAIGNVSPPCTRNNIFIYYNLLQYTCLYWIYFNVFNLFITSTELLNPSEQELCSNLPRVMQKISHTINIWSTNKLTRMYFVRGNVQ